MMGPFTTNRNINLSASLLDLSICLVHLPFQMCFPLFPHRNCLVCIGNTANMLTTKLCSTYSPFWDTLSPSCLPNLPRHFNVYRSNLSEIFPKFSLDFFLISLLFLWTLIIFSLVTQSNYSLYLIVPYVVLMFSLLNCGLFDYRYLLYLSCLYSAWNRNELGCL